MKAGLLGATGLVGAAIAEALREAGVEVVPITAPRLRHLPGQHDDEALSASLKSHVDQVRQVGEALSGCEVAVVAAGAADPTSPGSVELFGANGLLPGVVLEGARRAGVRRLVHISSAAVQGNRPVLDESAVVSPLSPYAASKAAGEAALRACSAPDGPEVVVYRPTSVLAAARPVSLQLLRLLTGPVVPVVGRGDAPQPLALLENVAAAAATLCLAPVVAGINVHPWEGMSIARLLDLADTRPIRVPVPARAVDVAVATGRRASSGRWLGLVRRIELYAHGQKIAARGLAGAGYVPKAGEDRYQELLKVAGRPPRKA